MTVRLLGLSGLPEVTAGTDLAALVAAHTVLEDGDVVVIAQKAVSKAEGAVVAIGDEPPAAARERLARATAERVVATDPVLIVRTAHGLVCANGGIDASNAVPGTVVLLPEDPDASARALRRALRAVTGADVGVVVTDTFGRPWRDGQTDVAIGVAGVRCIRDERSTTDRSGRHLEVTRVAVVDEIAAAADLVRRKADGVPVVVVRGLDWDRDEGAAARELSRTAATDLFPRARGRLADVVAAPEALVPVDEPVIARAVAAAVAVAGATAAPVVIRSEGTIRLRTAGSEGSTPPTGRERTITGAALGVALAVLVDAGVLAHLESGDPPAVVIPLGATAEPTGAP